MLNSNPLLLTDFYKVGHPFQYPKNTTIVYSNFTARKSRIKGMDKVVFFGLQYFIKEYLIKYFNDNFFNRPKEEVLLEYKRIIKNSLGGDLQSYKHISDLHDLGYLPIKIKALHEGSLVDIKIPLVTIINTKSEFYWVTNFIETIMSNTLWQPCTSATIAMTYKKLMNQYAEETGVDLNFVNWQGHDFSMRGMSSLESSVLSGMAHLLFFNGTDTIPAILGMEKYYNANSDIDIIGGSVPATEHSVMCAGTKENEIDTFRRLINEVYPYGILSIVSDTWDLWKVCTEYVLELKQDILNRNGKVVIRPDSGDPADILCGDIDYMYNIIENNYLNDGSSSVIFKSKFHDKNCRSVFTSSGNNIIYIINEMILRNRGFISLKIKDYATEFTKKSNKNVENQYSIFIKYGELTYKATLSYRKDSYYDFSINNIELYGELSPKNKGVIECLWDVFGGTNTDKGFKLLDSHIGAIYGDGITIERVREINDRLKVKGFASQVVFGIGSYTYQFNTRDTFGMAMKATYVELEDEVREIFKNPVTDHGEKKSAKGLLNVTRDENYNYVLNESVTKEVENTGELMTVFEDGKLLLDLSLNDIKNKIKTEISLTD